MRVRGGIKMLFKKLYYYYHHYKMWSYIVATLKKHPRTPLSTLKYSYSEKHCHKHLIRYGCFLCSYAFLVKTSVEIVCTKCPLYKKYGKNCLGEGSLFIIVNDESCEKRITAAEKIRDCILPWKNRK